MPYTIVRLTGDSAKMSALSSGHMPVKNYPYHKSAGLKQVTIREIEATRKPSSWLHGLKLDFLWMASYAVQPELPRRPFWNGFMQVRELLVGRPSLVQASELWAQWQCYFHQNCNFTHKLPLVFRRLPPIPVFMTSAPSRQCPLLTWIPETYLASTPH